MRTLYQRSEPIYVIPRAFVLSATIPYADSIGFQYKLLNDFAQRCFLGDLKGVKRVRYLAVVMYWHSR